jgi:hypothetical protein
MLSVLFLFLAIWVGVKIIKGCLFSRSRGSSTDSAFHIVQIQSGPLKARKDFLSDMETSIQHLQLGSHRMTWIEVNDTAPNSPFVDKAISITQKLFQSETGCRHPILILDAESQVRTRFESAFKDVCIFLLSPQSSSDSQAFTYTACPVCFEH